MTYADTFSSYSSCGPTIVPRQTSYKPLALNSLKWQLDERAFPYAYQRAYNFKWFKKCSPTRCEVGNLADRAGRIMQIARRVNTGYHQIGTTAYTMRKWCEHAKPVSKIASRILWTIVLIPPLILGICSPFIGGLQWRLTSLDLLAAQVGLSRILMEVRRSLLMRLELRYLNEGMRMERCE